jgi:hypothetical protein
MRTLWTSGAALLAATFLVANAADADCVGRDDLSALRTAAIQQELMVAALTCHDIGRYNHFVRARQAELIDSDGRLKAFFLRRDARNGEARYHTFKTELANAASLRSIRRTQAFCSNADDAFDLAERRMSLAAFVAAQPVALAGSYRSCASNDGGARLTVEAAAVPSARRAGRWRDDATPDDEDGDH